MNSNNPIRVGVRALIIRQKKILLVEFDDESGLHYNYPGGGVQHGESIPDGLVREVREETGAEVSVGKLLLTYEVFPPHYDDPASTEHQLGLIFKCQLINGSLPDLPLKPDTNQTGVKWIPIDKIGEITLLPAIWGNVKLALGALPGHVPFLPKI